MAIMDDYDVREAHKVASKRRKISKVERIWKFSWPLSNGKRSWLRYIYKVSYYHALLLPADVIDIKYYSEEEYIYKKMAGEL
jgi:hypothetical protein